MTPKLITSLSRLLQRISESNDLRPEIKSQKIISAFHGLARPNISIHSYLQRIFKYANCSPSCYVVAYIYLDRFTHRYPELQINSYSVHRLLITSVMVSAKFLDDRYYNNAYYAKVGGISTTEMNFLEVMILHVPKLQFPQDQQISENNHLCFSTADHQDESPHQKQHQLAV
ncbi:hypothetical protein F511_11026 [Dorcoceras hygrometricum]|uniref:Cyclin n=1 Tax=Dorcoceras hygrometricum TaxID=472368 RepID=A0A2Z7CRS9_9LAMI|nr:hypothetical protein F511_11026 [Dorcoceras hygrometricum]